MTMDDDNKIGHREALALIIIMMSGKIFLSFPRDMALLGDAAGWIIVLLSGLLSLSGFFFLNALIKKFPSQNIIEVSYRVTGPIFGAFFGFLIFFFFLANSSLIIRKFAETFILAILPRTPISIIIFFFLGLLVYGTLQGIETISRTAWFYGPYLLIALATILFFSLFQAHPLFLTPILGTGPLSLIKNSLPYMSMFSEILLLTLISPQIRKKKKLFGIGFFGILVALSVNLVVTMVTIMVFNYTSAARLIFPVFQLTRLIFFGEFIQRVESVFVFLWFFTAGIQLCGLFYGSVISFAGVFKIQNYRPLVFPMAIIVFTLSLIPSSMTEVIKINDFFLNNFYTSIAFGIPFLLWLLTVIFKKRLSGKK